MVDLRDTDRLAALLFLGPRKVRLPPRAEERRHQRMGIPIGPALVEAELDLGAAAYPYVDDRRCLGLSYLGS